MLKKLSKIIISTIFIGLIAVAILVIFSFVPVEGNYRMFVVQSGSMEPSIHTGSLVIVRPAREYRLGDVVTRSSSPDEATTTHRISSVREKDGEIIYDTKGDANNTSDGAEIHRADIIGKVYLTIPFVGYIIDFFKKPMGFMIAILIPTLIIIYEEIVKIKKEASKIRARKIKGEDEEEELSS